MTDKEKYDQINKEAKFSLLAVLLIVIFWIVAGFGVSMLGITIFHTPLWAITGCLGTWAFAIILSVWLVKRIYKDFSLDEEDSVNE